MARGEQKESGCVGKDKGGGDSRPYETTYSFRVFGAEEWLIVKWRGADEVEGHDGWIMLEHRRTSTWAEAHKRRGRWELDNAGRRDVVNFVSASSADAIEAYLNEHEPPGFEHDVEPATCCRCEQPFGSLCDQCRREG